MSRRFTVALIVIALGTGAPASAQQVRKDGSVVQFAERPVTQLIVKYKNETLQSFTATEGRKKATGLTGRAGVALSYKRQMSGMAHVLTLPQPMSRTEAYAVAKRLEMDANVTYAEVDEWVYPTMVPNDTYVSAQWHYYGQSGANANAGGINAPTAWDINRGQGVIVAVIDTGVASHPDLAANVITPGGYDFISDINSANDSDGRDADPSDPGNWRSATDCPAPNNTARNSNWHGTHVSGTIAAVTDNTLGVAGVAHQARILALRALGRCGGTSSDIADAITWAAGLPILGLPNNPNVARVINMSLGSSSPTCLTSTQTAINAARGAGAVVVVATGNDGSLTIGFPANCQGVIAVTAHTYQGDNASYANVGPGTTISAPGGGSCTAPNSTTFTCSTPDATASTNLNYPVWSTRLPGFTTPTSSNSSGSSDPTYLGAVGTSMATPHVSGVAALLLSQMPTLTPDEVSSLITNSSRPHPAGLYCATVTAGTCGSGLLDANAALVRLASRTPTLTVASSAQIVAGGQTVTLTATPTPQNGGSSSFTYTWTQVSGPTVILNGATTASPVFIGTNPGGTHVFNVTVRDALGYQATQSIFVRSNNAPTITPIGPVTVAPGASVSFNVSATDPENDSLTYVATNLPAGATFSASTGQFSWPTASTTLGNYVFNVVANDSTVNSASVAVTVTVANPPPPAPASPPASGGGGGGSFAVLQIAALALLSLLRRQGKCSHRKRVTRQ